MSRPVVEPTRVGPQVIFAFDATGICTLSAGPGLEALGLRPGQLVGENLFTLYGASSSTVDSMRRVLSGESLTMERERHGRILAVTYEPLYASDGTVTGAVGVSTDLTTERENEDAARIAREHATALADLSTILTREVQDPDALIDDAVRVMTGTLADVGVISLVQDGEAVLEARQVWRAGEPRAVEDWRAASPLTTGPLRRGESATSTQLMDLGVDRDRESAGALLCELAARFDLAQVLRLPLLSRGQLLGQVDLARGRLSRPFGVAEVSRAEDLAERCALALDNALLLAAERDSHAQLVKFQALADASRNLIAISDLDGTFVYVNPRVREVGLDVDGQGSWGRVVEYLGPDLATSIVAGLDAEGLWHGDIVLDFPVGQRTLTADVFSIYHPVTGAAMGTAWLALDVTELREAEAQLLAANQDLRKFRSLVETSPDFIAIAGLDGTVLYVNPQGREMVGLDPDVDVTDTVIADYLTPEGLEASLTVEQPAIFEHGHWEGESTLRNLRGGDYPVAIASFLMRDADTAEPFALATVQRDITEARRAATELRDLAEQRQALVTRLVGAQDAERDQIAADVHDDPVQALAAVDLRLGLLESKLVRSAPELREDLATVQETVSAATERLRALLFNLEPPDLERGLVEALRGAAAEIFDGTVTACRVEGDDDPALSDAVRAIGYRVAKEALLNVRKHAQATDVSIRVATRDGGLEVSVLDDGVGLPTDFDEPRPGHRGLRTMEDRATVAGGTLRVTNREPRGTDMTVWLPGVSGG